jgi:hypothetical protein
MRNEPATVLFAVPNASCAGVVIAHTNARAIAHLDVSVAGLIVERLGLLEERDERFGDRFGCAWQCGVSKHTHLTSSHIVMTLTRDDKVVALGVVG